MMDNRMAQKLMQRHTCDMTDDGKDVDEFEEGTENRDRDLGDRSMLAAKNPVESARVYDKLVKTYIDIILRVAETNPGALGSIVALLGVTEAQSKGGLHLHGNGWGRVTADDITRHATDDEVMSMVYALLDSLVTGQVLPEHLPQADDDNTQPAEHVWYNNDIPTKAANISYDASTINSKLNHHRKCVPTCEPKKTVSNPKCRLSRPACPSPSTGISQHFIDDAGQLQTQAVSEGPGTTN